MRETFRHPGVPEPEKLKDPLESAEHPVVYEETVDGATAQKIEEAKLVLEMANFLKEYLNDPDEKVLGNMQLGEFFNVLEREREDFQRSGENNKEEMITIMLGNFKNYPRLYQGNQLDEILKTLVSRWTELKLETEKKLGHKI